MASALLVALFGSIAAPGLAYATDGGGGGGGGGTITGTVTDGGGPLAGIQVFAYDVAAGAYTGSAKTNGSGAYALTPSAQSTVEIAFYDRSGFHATQWYNGSASLAGSTPIDMTVGPVAGINAVLATAGVVTGQALDCSTNPLSRISVTAYDAAGTAVAGSATDGSGRFRIPGLLPGRYRLQYLDRSHARRTTWSATEPTLAAADSLPVVAGRTQQFPPQVLPLAGASHCSALGYWLVAADGGIFPFGNAGGYGSTGNVRLNQPIVGMARTPSAHGYWLVAADGGIFPFGDAVGYGSTGNIHLNQPIVGMAATHDGGGYWLVAADGGIFPFGDAVGYGSTGNIRLNRPIVGMAATHDDGGYWLVASDGGIFPFGDAVGYGSTGNVQLNQPIVAMEAMHNDRGYWLVARDGGIFPFGAAGGFGSTGNIHLNRPIVGMEATYDDGGYWLVASDGGIFPFGNAPGLGSTGNLTLNQPMVGMEESLP